VLVFEAMPQDQLAAAASERTQVGIGSSLIVRSLHGLHEGIDREQKISNPNVSMSSRENERKFEFSLDPKSLENQ